jgi:hypothetical protein
MIGIGGAPLTRCLADRLSCQPGLVWEASQGRELKGDTTWRRLKRVELGLGYEGRGVTWNRGNRGSSRLWKWGFVRWDELGTRIHA